MSDCLHEWQQVGIDLFRPAIQVRCQHCQAFGQVLEPTPNEVTGAFYASESMPIPFDDWQRVSSAGVETLSWAKQ